MKFDEEKPHFDAFEAQAALENASLASVRVRQYEKLNHNIVY